MNIKGVYYGSSFGFLFGELILGVEALSLSRGWSKSECVDSPPGKKTSGRYGAGETGKITFICIVYPLLYNNQINARALIGQSAVGYCYYKPTEKSRVFWIII